MDEDGASKITINEYYGALDAFHCRGELEGPFDDDTSTLPYQHLAVFRFMKVLREREIAQDELFRLIDYTADGRIDLKELKTVLPTLGQF